MNKAWGWILASLWATAVGVLVAVSLDVAAQPEQPRPVRPGRTISGEVFRARENRVSGVEAGEVVAGQQVVFTLRAPLGELSAYERAIIAAKRLNDALDDYGPQMYLALDNVEGRISIKAEAVRVVTVDEETAGVNRSSVPDLAGRWIANIRGALDAPEPAAPPAPRGAERDERTLPGPESSTR